MTPEIKDLHKRYESLELEEENTGENLSALKSQIADEAYFILYPEKSGNIA